VNGKVVWIEPCVLLVLQAKTNRITKQTIFLPLLWLLPQGEEKMRKWKEILKFNDKYFPKWRDTQLIYYSNALAGEVGEICDVVKHLYGGGTHEQKHSKNELFHEAIDVFIYLVLLLETAGVNRKKFTDIFNSKMKTLLYRVDKSKWYPKGRPFI